MIIVKLLIPLSYTVLKNMVGQGFQYFDLQFGYHELPLKEGEKVKNVFRGISCHRKE
jgi:hypothetical protein